MPEPFDNFKALRDALADAGKPGRSAAKIMAEAQAKQRARITEAAKLAARAGIPPVIERAEAQHEAVADLERRATDAQRPSYADAGLQSLAEQIAEIDRAADEAGAEAAEAAHEAEERFREQEERQQATVKALQIVAGIMEKNDAAAPQRDRRETVRFWVMALLTLAAVAAGVAAAVPGI